jgi:hypothetical protein
VPGAFAKVELGKIGDTSVDVHRAFSGQASRLHDTNRAQVDRDHIMTKLGEIHTIAPFAVTQTQRAPAGKRCCNLAQEVVWLGTEGKAGLGVSLIPTLAARGGA